jgi:hypothetical protein
MGEGRKKFVDKRAEMSVVNFFFIIIIKLLMFICIINMDIVF